MTTIYFYPLQYCIYAQEWLQLRIWIPSNSKNKKDVNLENKYKNYFYIKMVSLNKKKCESKSENCVFIFFKLKEFNKKEMERMMF